MIDPVAWAALAIVVVTLGLMLVRPGNLPEGSYAAMGAIAMLAAGAVPVADVPALLGETANVLLFLAGMLIVTGVVERSRLFEVIADACAQWSRHRGWLLFTLLYGLGALVTTFLSLDVTVVLLTPIILALTFRRAIDPVPFLFGCVFVANIASFALPVSNLTNLLVYDGLDLAFARFVTVMWWPNLIAAGSAFALLTWLFRHRIPHRFGSPPPDGPTVRVATRWTAFCGLVLAITLFALVLLGFLDYPLWWASAGGALVLTGAAAGRRRIGLADLGRDLSLPIFLFVIGMAIVVAGFERAWLDGRAIAMPASDAAALGLAVGVNAAGSNVVNNVPMALLSLGVIERAPDALREFLAYGTLVGANIGPALTTYGSLATILWLTACRRAGVTIETRDYLRVSLVVVPATLVVTAAALLAGIR